MFNCHCFQGAPGFRGPAGPNGIPGEKVHTSIPDVITTNRSFFTTLSH